MKKILTVIILFFIIAPVYSLSVKIPNFMVYTEMDNYFGFVTSYDFTMQFDTGLKYGVEMEFGFNGYQVQTLSSNFIELSTLKAMVHPSDWFQFGFFMGNNMYLGRKGVEYIGFQYHQTKDLEYFGYHTINGTGIEFAMTMWDKMFEPHFLIYSSPIAGTNYFNADTVLNFITETLEIEAYLGINFDTNFSLNKHIGVTFRTLNPKVNFLLSIYMPDSPFTDTPGADDIYVNFTEKLRAGIFEQVITIFMRPGEYNGTLETVGNSSFSDVDIYLAMGVLINAFGIGVENTLTYADPVTLGGVSTDNTISDRIGAYTYFNLNNLRYKLGVHYSMGPYYANTHTPDGAMGVFLGIQGEL